MKDTEFIFKNLPYFNNPKVSEKAKIEGKKIVLQAYRNALKDGKSIGWRSEYFTELTGIAPVDEKSGTDYGNEYTNNQHE